MFYPLLSGIAVLKRVTYSLKKITALTLEEEEEEEEEETSEGIFQFLSQKQLMS